MYSIFFLILKYNCQYYDLRIWIKNMQNCKNCIIIRYFLVSVLMLILIALVFTDKMKYLAFVNPEKISYFIIFLGILIFLAKIYNNYVKNLFISKKSNKVGNVPRKSSKGMSSKKIYCPHKLRLPWIFFVSPK